MLAVFCIFSLGRKLTLESFHRYLLVVFGTTTLSEPNENSLQRFEASMKVERAKITFSD